MASRNISITRTEAWEDCANLSFAAMQAEGIADIDARLEDFTEVVTQRVAQSTVIRSCRIMLPASGGGL